MSQPCCVLLAIRLLLAARALLRNTQKSAEEIVREALGIASEICIYSNDKITVVTLP